MAIINRTKDPSEQREVLYLNYTGMGITVITTGTTFCIGPIPYPANIIGAQMNAVGISGSPTVALAINRFIAGTGFTTIVVGTGTSNIPAEFGTSGAGAFGASLFGSSGMVLAAQGSTLLQLLANDLLTVTVAGTNAAAKFLGVAVCIQPTLDIKYRFGTGV